MMTGIVFSVLYFGGWGPSGEATIVLLIAIAIDVVITYKLNGAL